MLKKIFLITILSLAFVSNMFSWDLARAVDPGNCGPNEAGQNVCVLDNPLEGNKTDATAIIAIVIKSTLGIIGALTLLMFVWGGFEWLTSAGNPEKVKSGTQTMVWAIIGVALVFSSYLLLSTFTNYLTGVSK